MRRSVVVMVAAAVGVLCVGEAAAQAPRGSGILTMRSAPGDYIGAGKTYSFSGPTVRLGRMPPGLVTVNVRPSDVHRWWGVIIGAPDGGRLEPGTYEGVTRVPEPARATLNVFGEHRGCGETHGRFTVHDIDYGISGYVESLHVTFLQRCEEPTAPALRGEMNVTAEPPRDPLRVDVTFDPGRTTLDHAMTHYTVHGSIVCSRPARGIVRVMVEETGVPINVSGYGVGLGATRLKRCSTTRTDWALKLKATNGIPFTRNPAVVTVKAKSRDKWWSAYMQEHVYALDSVSGRVGPTPPRIQVSPPLAHEDAGWSNVPGFLSREPVWSIAIALAIFGAVAWALVVTVWLRGRRVGSRST